MTGTEMKMEFIKACSNLVDNTTMQEVMYQNAIEIEREGYTEEEQKIAAEFHATFKNKKLDIPAELKNYEKSHKAAAEAVMAPYADAALYDFIMPLADVESCLAGSTDVGDVSYICPTVQFKGLTEVAGTPAHTWQWTAQGKSSIAHKGQTYAAEVLAAAAIKAIENPEIIEKAKAEFNEATGGKPYQCPIPADVKPAASRM